MPNETNTGRHPIHSLLAAFPLALFTSALIADITYWNTAQMQWANFAVWLITGGVIMGLVAAIAGLVDAISARRSQRHRSTLHSLLTIALFIVAIINGFIHSRDAWTSVVPTGLILSVVTVALVWVTSWQGYTIGAYPARRAA